MVNARALILFAFLLVCSTLCAQSQEGKYDLEIFVGYDAESQGILKIEEGQSMLLSVVEGGPFDTVSVTIISDGFARFTEVDSGNYVIAVDTEVPVPFGLGGTRLSCFSSYLLSKFV